MKISFIGQFTALLMISGAASAALPPVVDGRIQSPQVNSGTLEMYNRLQQLQNEVRQLQGQVEEQAYTIDTLKKRQRDLYLDIDRRIESLESGNTRVPAQSSTDKSLDASGTKPVTGTPPQQLSKDQDKIAYEKAFSSLKSGRYKQAITDFSDFTVNYPNSEYLPNALYWLGEASYVNRDFKQASTAFNKVVTQYPTHSKSKDALLKIGFLQYENKQWKAARESLTTVSKKYPGSTAARLANQRLDRMRKEKR